MRIDGENYEYHEQTKQTSHLSIWWLQIIANGEYTIVVKIAQCQCYYWMLRNSRFILNEV